VPWRWREPRAAGTTASSSSACSDATLHGTYSYGYEGWTVSKSANSPTSTAGLDHFNGAGSSTGVTTFVDNGVVENNNAAEPTVAGGVVVLRAEFFLASRWPRSPRLPQRSGRPSGPGRRLAGEQSGCG